MLACSLNDGIRHRTSWKPGLELEELPEIHTPYGRVGSSFFERQIWFYTSPIVSFLPLKMSSYARVSSSTLRILEQMASARVFSRYAL